MYSPFALAIAESFAGLGLVCIAIITGHVNAIACERTPFIHRNSRRIIFLSFATCYLSDAIL